MCTHTPAPWFNVASQTPGSHRILTGGPEGIPHIAYIPKNAYATVESEALANAQLIASAPELLEILSEFVAHLIQSAKFGLNQKEVDMLKRGEAILAKAEGRNQ